MQFCNHNHIYNYHHYRIIFPNNFEHNNNGLSHSRIFDKHVNHIRRRNGALRGARYARMHRSRERTLPLALFTERFLSDYRSQSFFSSPLLAATSHALRRMQTDPRDQSISRNSLQRRPRSRQVADEWGHVRSRARRGRYTTRSPFSKTFSLEWKNDREILFAKNRRGDAFKTQSTSSRSRERLVFFFSSAARPTTKRKTRGTANVHRPRRGIGVESSTTERSGATYLPPLLGHDGDGGGGGDGGGSPHSCVRSRSFLSTPLTYTSREYRATFFHVHDWPAYCRVTTRARRRAGRLGESLPLLPWCLQPGATTRTIGLFVLTWNFAFSKRAPRVSSARLGDKRGLSSIVISKRNLST